MHELNSALAEKYINNFVKEVSDNVEKGELVKMCIHCGICAGSCPLASHWEHNPLKIFMLISTNQREVVLNSDSMWMCTSCYNCVVRCPSKVPISHIMHGLATYSLRMGLTPKNQPTAKFAQLMWNNLSKAGRVNELKLAMGLYFMNGFRAGVNTAMGHQKIGLAMLKAERMRISEIWAGHRIKDKSGLQAMLKKAEEIETSNIEANSK